MGFSGLVDTQTYVSEDLTNWFGGCQIERLAYIDRVTQYAMDARELRFLVLVIITPLENSNYFHYLRHFWNGLCPAELFPHNILG